MSDRKLAVHVLVCVFAVSSWVDINGLWVELPLLVTSLPEGWTLPSYITVLSQAANLGPLLFLALAWRYRRRSGSRLWLDSAASYVILAVGVVATLLLAFFWDTTVPLGGAGQRSVALLALSLCLSLVDCTSSVAYVAFMSALHPAYLPSFFVGEGLSGLIPALMALGQGAGDIVCRNGSKTEVQNVSGVMENVTSYFLYPEYVPPRFSVQVFFLLLSAMIGASLAAFLVLNFSRYCKDQFVTHTDQGSHDRDVKKTPKSLQTGDGVPNTGFTADEESFSKVQVHTISDPELVKVSDSMSHRSAYGSQDDVAHIDSSDSAKQEVALFDDGVSMATTVFLLLQVVVINFLITSFLLSVQVFSSLPYGLSVYSLAVTLSNIANPLACVVSLFRPVAHPAAITALTTLGLACSGYIVTAAAMSPFPPLVGTTAGGPIAVCVWVGASFFLTFGKVSVAGVMRREGRRRLLAYGVATQLGALIGAVIGFVLVNDVKVFKDAPWC